MKDAKANPSLFPNESARTTPAKKKNRRRSTSPTSTTKSSRSSRKSSTKRRGNASTSSSPGSRKGLPTAPPSKRFTLRGYARHRKRLGLPGGTLRAVQKAIEFGRIKPEPDGRLDVATCDADWTKNTDERRQPNDPASCAPTRTRARGGTQIHKDDESGESFTFAEERTRKERIDRRLKELDLKVRLGELVDVDRAAALNFRVARQIRSRLEAIPDRLAEILAAETSPQSVDELLRSELAKVLELLGADPSGAVDLSESYEGKELIEDG